MFSGVKISEKYGYHLCQYLTSPVGNQSPEKSWRGLKPVLFGFLWLISIFIFMTEYEFFKEFFFFKFKISLPNKPHNIRFIHSFFCYEIILETDFTSTHLIIYLTSKYNFKLLFMLALLVEHIFFTPFYGLYFNHQFVTHFFNRHPLELLPVLGPWERDRATYTWCGPAVWLLDMLLLNFNSYFI